MDHRLGFHHGERANGARGASFLLPIAVKAGKLIEEPEAPTTTEVQ